jgi:hypothetical protein
MCIIYVTTTFKLNCISALTLIRVAIKKYLEVRVEVIYDCPDDQ